MSKTSNGCGKPISKNHYTHKFSRKVLEGKSQFFQKTLNRIQSFNHFDILTNPGMLGKQNWKLLSFPELFLRIVELLFFLDVSYLCLGRIGEGWFEALVCVEGSTSDFETLLEAILASSFESFKKSKIIKKYQIINCRLTHILQERLYFCPILNFFHDKSSSASLKLLLIISKVCSGMLSITKHC